MFLKIKEALKACFIFWKSFICEADKKKFLQKNQGAFKTQIIVLLATLLVCFVVYSSMRPAVRGVCRIVLRSADSDMDMGFDRVIGVEAKKVITGTTLREVKSIGTLKANAEVVIKAEISGKIAEILFEEGSKVHKGDTLIKFEDDLYKAEKDKYEAEYTMMKAEYERVDNLYKQKVGSKKAYDEAFAKMQSAQAQLSSATAQLARTVIKAPFDGTIGILKGSVTPGNMVQQQTELVYIVDNSMMKVEFSVPAKYINDVAPGQNVEITVDAYSGKTFSGTVEAIDSEVDTKNHSVLVKAVIPNKSGQLKHGMFANVRLVTGEKSDVVLIDEDALLREGSIEYVWVIDEKGRAYRKRVLSGAKDINGVEIVAGLREGETVVTTGQLKLSEGLMTKILNKEEYEASAKGVKSDNNAPEDDADTDVSSNEEQEDGNGEGTIGKVKDELNNSSDKSKEQQDDLKKKSEEKDKVVEPTDKKVESKKPTSAIGGIKEVIHKLFSREQSAREQSTKKTETSNAESKATKDGSK